MSDSDAAGDVLATLGDEDYCNDCNCSCKTFQPLDIPPIEKHEATRPTGISKKDYDVTMEEVFFVLRFDRDAIGTATRRSLVEGVVQATLSAVQEMCAQGAQQIHFHSRATDDDGTTVIRFKGNRVKQDPA